MEKSNIYWNFDDDDLEIFDRLVSAIDSLKYLTTSGTDLIALGEVIDAINSITKNLEIDINVGLSIGFRARDGESEEGIFMCLRINADELTLDELNTTYSRSTGSDHSTIRYVNFTPDSKLNDYELSNWLNKLDEIKSFEEARLTVSRDHI